ncbi:MAG: SRPBCC domain-containing protein [Chitinophagaceae bacterium]
MEQQDFHCSITAGVTPEQAFSGINDVAAWWSKSFKGASEHPGDVFTVRFGETFAEFEITEVIPNKKIVWFTRDCNLHFMKDKKEWKGTSLNWEISSNGDTTRVDMTHVGLVPEIECYHDCIKGWTFYVTSSLHKLLTEGKGIPDDKDHSARNRQ